MANIKSAIKRAKQNTKIRAHNASQRSSLRTRIKKIIKSIMEKNHELASSNFQQGQSEIDKAVSHGLIHKNKAARIKSRLNTRIKALVKAD